jgi:hypothetical protein
MRIAYEVASLVINHNTPIEGMIFESTILPALLLLAKIMGEQAGILADRCGGGR